MFHTHFAFNGAAWCLDKSLQFYTQNEIEKQMRTRDQTENKSENPYTLSTRESRLKSERENFCCACALIHKNILRFFQNKSSCIFNFFLIQIGIG